MTDRLFLLLVLLTLLDLAFVQATDVVGTAELWPLWLLALVSPWLRRLQRHTAYRVAWNLGVLLVFALLVQHATTTGLLHMLEDGLVLSVLCQVHLLNNLGERQRPDLIFFNSFLVAFVTSFFTPDLSWSLLFIAHAFVLVPSLQLHSLLRRRPDVGGDVIRAVFRDSVPRTLVVGALSAAVFVVWPRDFRREGWIGEAMALQQQFQAGLAERIRIGDEQHAHLGDQIVAQLQPGSGRPEDVPAHWRAIAFSVFDGGAWSPQDASLLGSRFASDPPWERRSDGTWRREIGSTETATVRVRLLEWGSRRLCSPLATVRLTPTEGLEPMLDPKSFGGFAVLPQATAMHSPLQYEVEIGSWAGAVTPTARSLRHFTNLPERLPGVVRTLAEQIRAGMPANTDRLVIARATSEWLQQRRRYQLPGGPGFSRNLGEFLLGTGAGHCEYFATALALLLRVQDVPCRLVGGFLAHEWNAEIGAVVVRSKHAHAWVEALDERGTWHTLDPTPAADVMAGAETDATWWTQLRTDLENWWAAVTGFDKAAQARWLTSLRALPAEHPFALCVTVFALLSFVYWRRRRRLQPPAIGDLQRALRAARLAFEPGETPRELLARAAAAGLDPRKLTRLRTATHLHESTRYGAHASPGGRR